MSDPVGMVHVIAKTHLDLGFTALAGEVVDQYLGDFFPRAIAVADQLRQGGGPERLVWTTGSWILHQALEAGTPAQRDAVASAVQAGDLAWHALPVTTHTELMDADLVRSGLGISAELDLRFGGATTAAKMTDVPGHTRSLVPLLAEAGVTFLHLGVNPAWPVPEVPPVFRWQAPDGSDVVVAYQQGGYGGTVAVPGCDQVLVFLHTADNLGPPSVEEVRSVHAELRRRYPDAEVRASTLDAFARALASSGAAGGLPIVTAEIGDPWIFGTGSDPQKVSAFRALLRLRPRRPAVDRHLLLVAEHTWGLDQKAALPDTEHWDGDGLASMRATEAGQRFESSWTEQRGYVEAALDLLPADARAVIIGPDDLAEVVAPWPFGPDGTPRGGESGFVAVASGEVIDGGRWRVSVDPANGSLCALVDVGDGRVLADENHPLGLVSYQSFDEADYERFYAGLSPLPDDEWWARWDNTKPGIAAAGAVSRTWHPELSGAWHATHQGGAWHDLLVRLTFPPIGPGAPSELWSRWFWSHEPSGPAGERSATDDGAGDGAGLELTLWWLDKPANRLPEALWCSFVPTVAEPDRWLMDKLGQPVSPLDVVRHGGRSLHGVGDSGVSYDGPDGDLRLRTLDAPLMAPGRPNLLDADPRQPDLAGGWHVLLYDNCWGTNFPMWNGGPARFRFEIST